jgi:hypothetical protein
MYPNTPYWLVMEIEKLLGWERTLQINNQLIKHNIAGVITICVVLDQSTVIFQKKGGGGNSVPQAPVPITTDIVSSNLDQGEVQSVKCDHVRL